MKIIRNSARCTACGIEIESRYRHDFSVHFCEVEASFKKEWYRNEKGEDIIVEDPTTETWRFAVDGGLDYIRRVGKGYADTSIYDEEKENE